MAAILERTCLKSPQAGDGTNLFVVPGLARFYDNSVAALAEQRQRLVAELAALLRIDRHFVVQLLQRSMT